MEACTLEYTYTRWGPARSVDFANLYTLRPPIFQYLYQLVKHIARISRPFDWFYPRGGQRIYHEAFERFARHKLFNIVGVNLPRSNSALQEVHNHLMFERHYMDTPNEVTVIIEVVINIGVLF